LRTLQETALNIKKLVQQSCYKTSIFNVNNRIFTKIKSFEIKAAEVEKSEVPDCDSSRKRKGYGKTRTYLIQYVTRNL